MAPVFADRDHLIRSAGLAGTAQVYAVMGNREGEVLARVGGAFDADKASKLREILALVRAPGLRARTTLPVRR